MKDKVHEKEKRRSLMGTIDPRRTRLYRKCVADCLRPPLSLSLFLFLSCLSSSLSNTPKRSNQAWNPSKRAKKKYFVQRVCNTLDVFYVVIIIFSKLRIRVQLSWRWFDEMGPRFNSSLSSSLSAVTEEAKALLQRLGGESWKTATGFLDSAFSTKGWRVLFKEMVMHKI